MESNYTPRMLFLEVTTECNLRCKQCFMWKLKDRIDILPEQRYLELIRDFKQINGSGAVILTGGEIFRKENLVFSILGVCNELGLESVINTNGTLITEESISRLITDGPNKLVFSLDSHKPELHDFIRGISGTFELAVDTIKKHVEQSKKNALPNKGIYISTILHQDNIFEIKEMIDFSKQLGVNGIAFQPLIPSFYSNGKIEQDYFYKNFFFKDPIAASLKIDELAEMATTDRFILNTNLDLQKVKQYIHSPFGLSESICNAHSNNLVVDHSGNLKYCYNMEQIFPATIGNVRLESFSSLLFTEQSIAARDIMKKCTMSCGILNCNK